MRDFIWACTLSIFMVGCLLLFEIEHSKRIEAERQLAERIDLEKKDIFLGILSAHRSNGDVVFYSGNVNSADSGIDWWIVPADSLRSSAHQESAYYALTETLYVIDTIGWSATACTTFIYPKREIRCHWEPIIDTQIIELNPPTR